MIEPVRNLVCALHAIANASLGPCMVDIRQISSDFVGVGSNALRVNGLTIAVQRKPTFVSNAVVF